MIILNLVITFRIYSRFNGLNPLLDEVPSFLGNRKTKEILNVTYLVSDAQSQLILAEPSTRLRVVANTQIC